MPYEAVIGLEVHAQLKTQTKIFCGCSAAFGAPPNTHVCPVCLGMPGSLPVLNRRVVDFALRMALATGCRIARTSRFARKNYFYPDLPKGYQISQYELPIAEHGAVDITVDGKSRRIGITRIHMEEDAGKLTHDPDRPVSRVDLNRAGVPLLEIVSEPDLRTPEEAGAYLRKLRTILRYLDISDGNMEEGSFRCDANVSLRPRGQVELGTRTELKNINSFRFVEKALHYEIQRQREILEDGGRVIQETRLWDDAHNRTYVMRGKEEAHDYRYFPDPDLLPLVIDEAWIETVRQSLPELPDPRRRRYVEDFGLPDYDAEVLTSARELADYFEACVGAGAAAKPAANWIMGSLLGLLKAENRDFDQIPVPAPALAELLRLIDEGTISGKIAKTVFDEMAASGRTAAAIVAERGLVQISDAGQIGAVVDRILAANAGQVEAYRSGKTKIFGFFVGQVMRETRGKANPKVVNDLLREKLGAG
ncbi:MAG TPA: Asp-tRNA(Asn)/Glu-tRNA(Gln) amidotransferase subunit GatB [Desulfobacteraceae bacterium]|nr:Asp-tRNA(Asn)/Glu-tRNA(Gln) amidotransferase subunit GatB [Deltaproteobacteria bacterium]HDI58758.1 Asp-tRNA(Asn)/Glu-tRNA(Gln) amidotransferase subunit GatB [Desulfobacteraceae bacterium]